MHRARYAAGEVSLDTNDLRVVLRNAGIGYSD